MLKWLNTRRHRRAGKADDAGFTLIELLIVVAIIAILAGTVLPQFTGRQEQARRSRAIADIDSLSMALEIFETDMGRYPTTEEGLDTLMTQPSSDEAGAWQGPYLKRKVSNDPWGRPYVYVSPGTHNTATFDLFSYGKDGQEGGEGADADVVNWDEENAE